MSVQECYYSRPIVSSSELLKATCEIENMMPGYIYVWFSRSKKSETLTDSEICTRGTEFNMATSKQEVLTIRAVSKIDT